MSPSATWSPTAHSIFQTTPVICAANRPPRRTIAPAPDRPRISSLAVSEKLSSLKPQVYTDPRPKEYFDRFHARARTRGPSLVYDSCGSSARCTRGPCCAPGHRRPERARDAAAIMAPNHFSYMDHFLIGVFIRRKVRFMAKSQLFSPLARWVYLQGGVFPVRRGARDEEAFITAEAILGNGGVVAMYPEGGRSRTGELAAQAKPGVGRLALESGAPVVPIAIYGSSKIRNWKRLRFPACGSSTASRCTSTQSLARRASASSRSLTRSSPRSARSTAALASATVASGAQPAAALLRVGAVQLNATSRPRREPRHGRSAGAGGGVARSPARAAAREVDSARQRCATARGRRADRRPGDQLGAGMRARARTRARRGLLRRARRRRAAAQHLGAHLTRRRDSRRLSQDPHVRRDNRRDRLPRV